jgi:hypothetical protein
MPWLFKRAAHKACPLSTAPAALPPPAPLPLTALPHLDAVLIELPSRGVQCRESSPAKSLHS